MSVFVSSGGYIIPTKENSPRVYYTHPFFLSVGILYPLFFSLLCC
nr:MAG TPA: hypothetical protein [Caudoviricetes sp.]